MVNEIHDIYLGLFRCVCLTWFIQVCVLNMVYSGLCV